MRKPRLISGIQPSGRLHVGNYLGALKNFVDLQNSGKYECFFFIADYHSLTEDYNPKEKRGQIHDLAATYLAAGLSPKKSTLFIQSQIPAHTELAWILNTLTPMGELRRMTQFKDKATKGSETDASEQANVGLFTYPVLMAADIVMYDAAFVPVGDDQLQHLELTRTLARKFNSRFGNHLIEPKPLLTKFPRVMSLKDPEKKMSKSDPASCLFLDDEPEVIKEKLMRAVTDSGSEIRYDEKEKPAISNLLEIYSGLANSPIPEAEKKFKNAGYADFKKQLAAAITHALKPFREEKTKLKKQSKQVDAAFKGGAKKANVLAAKKIKAVKTAVGLPG
jgi:tryptophanyl-tRNA synthetase